MSVLPPFDPNGYRKRVLAAVERRGGPDAADPFELYDLPVEVAVDDATAAARVAEVWAFWQRQRDHPRYRALVALLVETHAARSAELLESHTRRSAAVRARARRDERETARYALLDAAIERLVARHGGIPADKVAGLVDIGALDGLGADEVAARVGRHRVLELGIGGERRRQIRALLEEFGRLTGVPAPPTLLALLGLRPSASQQQVADGAAAWRSRARELPAGRLRAVVDELLVHAGDLLVPGPAAVAAYLDAVAVDVADHLRPRVRAAVLVEDRLVADDRAHLVAEALDRGLDERRAAAVVAALAAELGAEVEPDDAQARPGAGDSPASGTGGRGRRGRADPPGGGPPAGDTRGGPPTVDPADLVRRARAALRAGRPREAGDLVAAAAAAADPGSAAGRQVRALSDEITAVLAAASTRADLAAAAAAARCWVAALEHLDQLARTAADAVPALEEHRARARAEVTRADERVAGAVAGPPGGQEEALRAVLAACRDHPGAREALEAATAVAPPAAPAWVSAARDRRGDVLVLWAPSTSDDVTYRVRRLRPDGGWQVVGRVPVSTIEDGGAPAGVEAPVYAVTAIQAGRSSRETRSDVAADPLDAPVPAAAPARAAEQAAPGPAAPAGVLAVRAGDGTVDITWTPVARDVEYRVRRRDGDRWQVIGRTRATRMQDGGAPAGLVPVYAVSAAAGGVRSAEARSAEG